MRSYEDIIRAKAHAPSFDSRLPTLPPVSSRDELMWRCGFMPAWLKRELGPVKIVMPDWLVPADKRPPPEEWRPFRDGVYLVSSHGNIKRNKPGIATFVGRPVRPAMTPTGYAQVQIGKQRLYVHRVVAEAFLGPCPSGHVVNHKDGNKLNNRLANLEYATFAQNSQHALALRPRAKGPTKPKPPPKGRQTGDKHWSRRNPEKVARGERAGQAKVTAEIVATIRARVADGEQQVVMAREFGLSVAQVSRIVRGLRWEHVGGGQ